MTAAGLTAPVLAAALGSAFFFAVSSVTKHVSAGQSPPAPRLRAAALGRFVLITIRHPLWLAGIATDVAGVALQVVALHIGALAVVQPLLLAGLVFAIVLRGAIDRELPVRQLGWALVLVGALAGFLALTRVGDSTPSANSVDRFPAVVSALCGLAVVAVAMVVGSRTEHLTVRAVLMGLAAGTIYATTAALLKGASDVAVHSPLQLFASWQLYTLLVVGAAGLLVSQLGFQAGALAAGLPVAATVDPLLSIVIGVAVFDERVELGPGDGAVLGLLLVVLAGAVLRLAVLGDRGPAAEPSRT